MTFSLALEEHRLARRSRPPRPTNNFITVTRYHVEFRRTDGRNTPGVDVPYAFDGAGTVTVAESAATHGVRARPRAGQGRAAAQESRWRRRRRR